MNQVDGGQASDPPIQARVESDPFFSNLRAWRAGSIANSPNQPGLVQRTLYDNQEVPHGQDEM